MKNRTNRIVLGVISTLCMSFASCGGDSDSSNIAGNGFQFIEQNEEGSFIKKVTVKGVTFNMVLVDGGTFQMGATTEQTTSGEAVYDNEFPVHNVQLSSYYIAETEVTNELWDSIMGTSVNSAYQYPRSGSHRYHPRNGTYDMFSQFIEKLNQETGLNFRFPTEAEWEFAARGGNKSKGYVFSGSDSRTRVGWYYCNSGNGHLAESNWNWWEWQSNENGTHVVASAYPNELGIYDMSGNLFEFCSDYYGLYSNGDVVNPKGPSEQTTITENFNGRVIRGGSYAHFSNEGRCSHRRGTGANIIYLGCRLALD